MQKIEERSSGAFIHIMGLVGRRVELEGDQKIDGTRRPKIRRRTV